MTNKPQTEQAKNMCTQTAVLFLTVYECIHQWKRTTYIFIFCAGALEKYEEAYKLK